MSRQRTRLALAAEECGHTVTHHPDLTRIISRNSHITHTAVLRDDPKGTRVTLTALSIKGSEVILDSLLPDQQDYDDDFYNLMLSMCPILGGSDLYRYLACPDVFIQDDTGGHWAQGTTIPQGTGWAFRENNGAQHPLTTLVPTRERKSA